MLRLELVIYEALGASAGRRRAMVVDAINKDFSPQLMVQLYNQVRNVLPQQPGRALSQAAVPCQSKPAAPCRVLSGDAGRLTL